MSYRTGRVRRVAEWITPLRLTSATAPLRACSRVVRTSRMVSDASRAQAGDFDFDHTWLQGFLHKLANQIMDGPRQEATGPGELMGAWSQDSLRPSQGYVVNRGQPPRSTTSVVDARGAARERMGRGVPCLDVADGRATEAKGEQESNSTTRSAFRYSCAAPFAPCPSYESRPASTALIPVLGNHGSYVNTLCMIEEVTIQEADACQQPIIAAPGAESFVKEAALAHGKRP